jgi:2-amino-4-hydroxy-6-hydroxymethyldihydropteridine diphosphokinase
MARAFIGVGSNISPEENICDGLRRIAECARLVSISTFYRQPAIDRPEDPDFYNGVIEIDTDLPPTILKWQVLRPIEAALGRRRTGDKYAPRTIDLDLLLYDDCVISSNDLVIPDPDILKRAFITIPLCEIAPNLILPASALSIRQLAEHFENHNMEPEYEYTRDLRRDLLDANR